MPRPRRYEGPDGRTHCPKCDEWKFYHEFTWKTQSNGTVKRSGYCKVCTAKYHRERYEKERLQRVWDRVSNSFDSMDEKLAWEKSDSRFKECADIYEAVWQCIESSGSTQVELLDGLLIQLNVSVIRNPPDSLTDGSTTTKNGPADS